MPDKRVVLLLPNGVRQILGYITEAQPIPTLLHDDPPVSLIRVTSRAAYYYVGEAGQVVEDETILDDGHQ